MTDADPLARMRRLSPQADPLAFLPDVDPARIPRHVAIIMDGNGRWARARGLPRMIGHRYGAEAVRRVVERCGRLGIEVLTLYSFSLENWKRPRDEIDALMRLCVEYLASEREQLLRENMRLRVIGSRDGLPAPVVEAIEQAESLTATNSGATLCLAINYSARAELAAAARALAARALRGEIDPQHIDEDALARELTTHGLPDPDLLIRTAGEHRVSNFLLWQISYAEIHVSRVLWPDFDGDALVEAVRDFASRERRFGALT